MKVLLIHVAHIPAGGADKVYFNTIDLLEQNGHSVACFSYKNLKNVTCDQEKYFVDAPSKLESVLHTFYNRQAAERIEQLLLDEKPDIAHLHSFWGGLTPSILKVLRKHNVPAVHTVHDYNLICPVTTSIDRKGNICESCKGRKFYKCILKRCFKGSIVKSTILASGLAFRRKFYDPTELIDGYIFPSHFVYGKHLQYMPGLRNSNNLILYNFNPEIPTLNVSQNRRKYFLYLGRLSHEKGLITLIKAFTILKNIPLIIAGTGPMEDHLKSIVSKVGATNIEFVGFRSGIEWHSIVSGASFNIVPSEWWENNPLSIIESYSAGIPVIGANVGGIPEIVVEGETGYLFRMKNVDQLAKVISKANSLSDEEYNIISTNAVRFALEKFGKEQNYKSLIGFYEQMIHNKKKLCMKKKIYIAGCGGMLGEAFYHQFKNDYIIKCTDKDVNADWLSFLDFRDFDAYKQDVEDFNPDFLFHLGAYTDLEWCEMNSDETYLTNTLCVENAVYIANKFNIPVLYISTAGIFDGKKEFYDDWDQPNPLGVYARSKYMGERFVCENAMRYIVCRAGWMMGSGPRKDKKFIQKLMKQLKDGEKELFIVNDKDGTPTYTHDFAKTVRNLIEKEYWGLYNCVCGGQTSRLEVAQELIKILGKEDEIKINVVTSEYFSKEYFAERPASERLLTKKLQIRGVSGMRDWKISLQEYIDNYYKGYLL